MAQPVPPCAPGEAAVTPFYGAPAGPPAVRTWRDLEIDGSYPCLAPLRGRNALVVALAGRFEGPASSDDIAARIGAISATEGLVYWSTTDQQWRTLVSDAYAIDDPDARHRRPDFTAAEVTSGRTLYFGQNDTRSTGLNVYSLTARSAAPGRLAVEIVNVTAIRFTFVTLFEADSLRSLHFFERLDGNGWGYYGISAVRAGSVAGHENSFVNRAGAFYRFLTGAPADAEPPLAR